jgi:hypothetical protein
LAVGVPAVRQYRPPAVFIDVVAARFARPQRGRRSSNALLGAWYAARYGHALALPVPVPVVVQFIVDHAARRHEDGNTAGDGIPAEAGQPLQREKAPARQRRKRAT